MNDGVIGTFCMYVVPVWHILIALELKTFLKKSKKILAAKISKSSGNRSINR